MNNIFIYRDLETEFKKHTSDKETCNEIQIQKASWKFGVYPSTFQIYEIQACQQDDSRSEVQFFEFCLLIATIKYAISCQSCPFKKKPQGKLSANQKPKWDVFLGGACNPTTWRLDVAIPFLKEKNITFYNPQVSKWDPSLIEIEDIAKESARVLLFVLDLKRTRGIASLVEAAFLSGQGRNLILVIPSTEIKSEKDSNYKLFDEVEIQSLNRSHLFIADLAQRQGIPLFSNVQDALKATRICLISKSMVQDLTDIDGVVPVKHSYVNVSNTIRTLQLVFQSLDSNKSGTISQSDAKRGLQMCFNQPVPLISTEKNAFIFSEFCIEYSILLLISLSKRKDHLRSHSEVNLKLRANSLDMVEKLDQDITLKSSINIKPPTEIVCADETHVKQEVEMTALCNCFNSNNKLAYCLVRLFRCPLRRSVIRPMKIMEMEENTEYSKLKLQLLTPEEEYDIYLGGTCGNSNWREEIAIPLIIQAGCTYHDPKIYGREWSKKLLPINAEAREKSKILVYIITNECTSTATLVEASHFIGQGKRVVLFVQMLTGIYSPPATPMSQLLQSSCSFPLSSTNVSGNHSFFSSLKTAESTTTGYQSTCDTSNSQFSLPPLSAKLSTSHYGHMDRNMDTSELAISINNISKFNCLSQEACMDHNRGRKYLLDLAKKAKVPILPSIHETILQAIKWSQSPSSSHGWTKKSNS